MFKTENFNMTTKLRHSVVKTLGLLLSGVSLAATATLTAQAQETGKHGADYSYAEGSPTYWRNMHSTRPNDFVFQRDPSVWVYTKEVAQRVGMPLEWASDELKGVAAAAFRMEPDSKGPNCSWGGNPKACKVEMRCVLELYFDRQAHVLPWDMRMQVADFDWQDVSSAFHFLPAQGWRAAPNGDVSRGSKGSPNYPTLGSRGPFTDPKTGEELGFADERNGATMRVLAYDKEIHGRYAFVRLQDGCGRSKHLFSKGEVLQLRHKVEANVPTGLPVFHEVRLAQGWIERIRAFTEQIRQQDNEFYKNIWNNMNAQGDKK
jgi:hypothetical protein